MEKNVTIVLDDKNYTTSPECYQKFSCKGGACRNTCCQRWSIILQRSEYNKVGTLCNRNPTLPNKNEIFCRIPRDRASDVNYATIKLDPDTHLCPLLTEDKLCGLQLECGYSVLPSICKRFPRLRNYINNEEVTQSLDISCEAVLELLYDASDEPLKFITEPSKADQVFSIFSSQENTSDYILDIRNLCILILQNRAYSLPERLILLGIALRDLQKLLDDDAISTIPDWFARYMSFTKDCVAKDSLQQLKGNSEFFVHNNLRYLSLEVTRGYIGSLFQKIINSIEYTSKDGVSNFSIEAYHYACQTFQERFPNSENFFEHCLIMWMLKVVFPLGEHNKVWSSYIQLCSIYSIIQFTASTSGVQNIQELIDDLVLLFRHSTSSTQLDKFTSLQMQYNNSDTLAHIAILLLG